MNNASKISKELLVLTLLLMFNYGYPAVASGVVEDKDDVTIRPGIGIGIVKLGMNRDQITETLGKRDGKYSLPSGIKVEYSEWKEPGNNATIRVFFDSNGKVVQLNSEAPLPATADGITTNSRLTDVIKKYGQLASRNYKTKAVRIKYYDDVKRGIAFEFTWTDTDGESQKHMFAILVHMPGRYVIADADEHLVKH